MLNSSNSLNLPEGIKIISEIPCLIYFGQTSGNKTIEQKTLFYSLKKYFSNMSITSVNLNFILYDLGKKLKSIVVESFLYIQIMFNFSFIVTKFFAISKIV